MGKIEGKCKSVTISGCDKCAVVVDEVVTTVELINCKQVDVQATTSAPNWTIDKCDRTKVYLPEGSCKENAAIVLSSQSSSSNVYFPTANGEDMVEYAIPDQIKSTIKIGDKP